MKDKVLLLLVLFLAVVSRPVLAVEPSDTPVAPKSPVTLRLLSAFDAPPFAYMDGPKREGFEIDLGEALGKELGARVEWIKQSFNIPALASTLTANRADAVLSSMSVTEKRRQYFAFTRPYFHTSLAVATHRDVDWNKYNFKTGLTSLVTVGVQRRTTSEQWARKHLKARRKTYDTPQRLARALNNGDVFIIMIDEDILKAELARRDYKFKIVEKGFDCQDYAIAVNKKNQKLLSELNAALEKLDAEGTYDEIYNKWFGRVTDLPR